MHYRFECDIKCGGIRGSAAECYSFCYTAVILTFVHYSVSTNRQRLGWVMKQIAKELHRAPVLDKIQDYRRNWIQYVSRMSPNRLLRIIRK
jgi:hypothetical protein